MTTMSTAPYLPRDHSLRTVVEVLDDLTTPGATVPKVAAAHQISNKTVYRWLRIREAHPHWPTPEDVDAWDTWSTTTGDRRARNRETSRQRRKARILGAGPAIIDATGTRRRLQALVALGWTYAEIGDRLGWQAAAVSHYAGGRRLRIHVRNHAAVVKIYDQLSMKVPAERTDRHPKDSFTRERIRAIARTKGWVPPLAWDDDVIDNPDARPATCDTDRGAAKRAARAQALADIASRGGTLAEAAEVLGIAPGSLHTWCARRGHDDLYARLTGRSTGHRMGVAS